MKNRSLRAVLMVLVFTSCCLISNASPAQKRSLGFMDQLIRTNPLRALARYVSRKLSLDLYYPPPPAPQQQQLQSLQFQPQAFYYVPGAPPPVLSHYTKLPAGAEQALYYAPPVAMISPQMYHQPQIKVQYQHTVPMPNYVLHGVSYNLPLLPQPQQQMQPILKVQSAVSNYEPVKTESLQVQQPTPQSPIVPQAGILIDEHHHQYQHAYESLTSTQVESLQPTVATQNHNNIVSSAEEINEGSSDLLSLPQFPPLSPNVQMQIDGYEDSSSSDDMLKIFVIRPKDMQKLKSSSEEERARLMKGYVMKYIDLASGAQEMVLSSGSTESRNEISSQANSCIEPMCDPFLRKLIPELLSSTNLNENDDPLVIVKNSSDAIFTYTNPLLHNHRVDQSFETDNQPQVTVMRSVEEDRGSSVEILQGQHSTLKPQRVQLHYPRKKFLSAKVNLTAMQTLNVEGAGDLHPGSPDNKIKYLQHDFALPSPSSQQNLMGHDNSTIAISSFLNSSSSTPHFPYFIPKPKPFHAERSYPQYRYGSQKMAKQRNVRGSQFSKNKNTYLKKDVNINDDDKK